MFSVFKLSIAALLIVCTLGCGEKRPNPRDNPNFNEEALNDAASVKMQ